MKSTVNVLVFLILIASSGYAQVVKSYGFKIGTVTATQSFDYSIRHSFPTEYRWGIDVAGFVELFLSRHFILSPEVHFTQKGYSIPREPPPAPPEGAGQIIVVKPRLDYLSISLVAKFVLEAGAISPYLSVGPRIDVLLGKDDTSLEYASTDFGGKMGVGMEFSIIEAPTFLIEAFYSPSFGHAFENDIVTVTNKSFEVVIGARF